MSSLKTKTLVLGAHDWKKKRKLRNVLRFGWQTSSTTKEVTETIEEKYKTRWVSDDTIEIVDDSTIRHSTAYRIQLYRYEDEIPNIGVVKALELLYAIVNKLKIAFCVLATIALVPTVANSLPGVSVFEMLLFLVAFVAVSWNVGNLVENLISKLAEKKIEKGW